MSGSMKIESAILLSDKILIKNFNSSSFLTARRVIAFEAVCHSLYRDGCSIENSTIAWHDCTETYPGERSCLDTIIKF